MRYLKAYEGWKLNKILLDKINKSFRKEELEIDEKSKLIESIFNSLEKDGYSFIKERALNYLVDQNTGNLINNKMWLYVLDKVNGSIPTFIEIIDSKFELVCDKDVFSIRPFIVKKDSPYKNTISDLLKGISFDPYDVDVVDKIKDYIDRFEMIILNEYGTNK